MFRIKNKSKINNNDNSGESKKIKQNKKASKTVQEALNINAINENTVKVGNEEKYYIRIIPRNINILMDTVLLGVIDNFKRVLNMAQDIEILIVDKTERLEDNKNFIKELIDKKDNPIFKDILMRDFQTLNKESSKGASRDFYIIIPIKNGKEKEIAKQLERTIENQGFETLKSTKNDMKNMLQVYLERNFTNEVVKDYDM